ncbi:11207_t:CDS:2 [Paraglomus occultum]|uniref:11207_t:CDS:1 n=1 Tax=Paraglomus occultum TaxID=144539 RepID=A0A9N8WRU1_9GLOM|nr:11207_t:CDS:2 [Paraglomus occultum]
MPSINVIGEIPRPPEVDQLEIVQKLRKEVEQLKEEQRKTMEVMSEREKDHKHDNDDERVAELQSKMDLVQKLENAHADEREEYIAAATARLEVGEITD